MSELFTFFMLFGLTCLLLVGGVVISLYLRIRQTSSPHNPSGHTAKLHRAIFQEQ